MVVMVIVKVGGGVVVDEFLMVQVKNFVVVVVVTVVGKSWINILKIAVFWVVAPCSLVVVYQLHGATTQKTAIFILTAVRTSNPD
jgi:hypothetical protein